MIERQLDLLGAVDEQDPSPARGAELIAERLRGWKPRQAGAGSGLLSLYRALAEPADAGARMMPPT